MYKFTVLKSDSARKVLLAFLKILGTITGNICNGVPFQGSCGLCSLESSIYLKSTLLSYLSFSETFKAAVFLKIAGKLFLELRKVMLKLVLANMAQAQT